MAQDVSATDPGGTPVESGTRRESRRIQHSPWNGLDVRAWMRFTRSWFVCNPAPRTRSQLRHPAKFPEALAREFVGFFTGAGETVLDPFSGVGSTVAAAGSLGRRGVGIELLPEFHTLAQERGDLAEDALLLQGDARQATALLHATGVQQCDYILTSPPYWNMLREGRGNVDSVHRKRAQQGLKTAYSDQPEDLGNLVEYEEFLQELTAILADLRSVLTPNRYLTVVTQNLRVRSGEMKPLAWDLTAQLSRYYTFKGERIWVQDNKPLGCWGWPREFVTNVHHHYCLNFKNDRTDIQLLPRDGSRPTAG